MPNFFSLLYRAIVRILTDINTNTYILPEKQRCDSIVGE